MTIHLPLDSSFILPRLNTSVVGCPNPTAKLKNAVEAVAQVKRIVVVCGAGISVQAGIPDFRSSEGLFQQLKRDNPRCSLTSGKELFDISVFQCQQRTSIFCQMIAQLFELSDAATPTPFHRLLRALSDQGKLLRVYTQNIDGIESKSGLSFGVPEGANLRKPSKGASPVLQQPKFLGMNTSSERTPICIPLHGTLETLRCQCCATAFPLGDYLPFLKSGNLPDCPQCASTEEIRLRSGKRAHGIGKLKPSVVLYNEVHKDAELVGEAVLKDLGGGSKKGVSEADLVLVVGTSLKVPGLGTKRIQLREKRHLHLMPQIKVVEYVGLARRTNGIVQVLYLNLGFPGSAKEWKGLFDAWIHGDVHAFAEMVRVEIKKDIDSKSTSQMRGDPAGDSQIILTSEQLPQAEQTSGRRFRKPKRLRLSAPSPLTIIQLQQANTRSGLEPFQAQLTKSNLTTTPFVEKENRRIRPVSAAPIIIRQASPISHIIQKSPLLPGSLIVPGDQKERDPPINPLQSMPSEPLHRPGNLQERQLHPYLSSPNHASLTQQHILSVLSSTLPHFQRHEVEDNDEEGEVKWAFRIIEETLRPPRRCKAVYTPPDMLAGRSISPETSRHRVPR